MHRRTLIIALLSSTFAAGAVHADDDCKSPMSQWQPRAAVEEKARSMGWDVRRVRTDDGCYKVYARDAQGRRIEAEFDPVTLDLIEIEGGDDDHDDEDEHRRERRNSSGQQAPGATQAPVLPRNPLIGKPKAQVN